MNSRGIEFLSKAEIKAFQEKALSFELQFLNSHSKFYSRMFKEHAIDISKIKYLEDLQSLPVTSKKDLQIYNNDFLCLDKKEIIDYVTTSGTLGDPVTFGLSAGDLDRLAVNEALSFNTAGCDSSDIIQLMITIDRRFMAGLAYFLGAKHLGCGIIRVGNSIPQLQWDTIYRIKPNTCIVVPSFLLKLIEYAKANGIDYINSPLRRAICIGESLRNNDFSLNTLGSKITQQWPNLKLHSTYASTEMQSSFTECEYLCGGHVPAELIIVEFLDENNKPVAEDEPGEVTITTIGVRGMPLLRFKTGDICYHYSQACKCGRNTTRLSPVLGRRGQMIKYKGTTIYPSALYDILDNIPCIKNYIVEVYTNSIGTDAIKLIVGCNEPSDDFAKSLKDIFRSKVRVAPDIVFEASEIITQKQFPQMSRKQIKFVDLRIDNKN